MRRRDVNARRQPLKNLRKHRQERQNSRFELLPEVRERCQKSKKIDARAYVNEGSLQGRSRWPKPFQNPFPKHLKFRIPLDFFFRIFAQERPKSVPRASKSAPRAPPERPKSAQERPRAPQERPKSAPRASQERPGALQERPRAPQEQKNTQKHAKTCNNLPNHKKTHENAQKLPKTIKNALPRPGWVSNAG